MRCTYFEHLHQTGTDALVVANELQKLFCGYDGYDIMVCGIKMIDNDQLQFERKKN